MTKYFTLPLDLLSRDELNSLQIILNEIKDLDELSKICNYKERITSNLCKRFNVFSIEEVLKTLIHYGWLSCENEDFKEKLFKKATKNYLDNIDLIQDIIRMSYRIPETLAVFYNDVLVYNDTIDRKNFNYITKAIAKDNDTIEFIKKVSEEFNLENPYNLNKFRAIMKMVVFGEYQEIMEETINKAVNLNECVGIIYNLSLFFRDYCPITFFPKLTDREQEIIDFLLTKGDIFDAIQHFKIGFSFENNIIDNILTKFKCTNLNMLLISFIIERQNIDPYLFFSIFSVQNRCSNLSCVLNVYYSEFDAQIKKALSPLNRINELGEFCNKKAHETLSQVDTSTVNKINTIKIDEIHKKHYQLLTEINETLDYATDLVAYKTEKCLYSYFKKLPIEETGTILK